MGQAHLSGPNSRGHRQSFPIQEPSFDGHWNYVQGLSTVNWIADELNVLSGACFLAAHPRMHHSRPSQQATLWDTGL